MFVDLDRGGRMRRKDRDLAELGARCGHNALHFVRDVDKFWRGRRRGGKRLANNDRFRTCRSNDAIALDPQVGEGLFHICSGLL